MLSSSEQYAPYVAAAVETFQFPIIYRLVSHRMYHGLFYMLWNLRHEKQIFPSLPTPYRERVESSWIE